MLTPDIDENTLAAIMLTAADYGLANLQLNCLSKEELLDAQLHPESHRGLIVRVSGLSVYFINLKKEIQNEIIGRVSFSPM